MIVVAVVVAVAVAAAAAAVAGAVSIVISATMSWSSWDTVLPCDNFLSGALTVGTYELM